MSLQVRLNKLLISDTYFYFRFIYIRYFLPYQGWVRISKMTVTIYKTYNSLRDVIDLRDVGSLDNQFDNQAPSLKLL